MADENLISLQPGTVIAGRYEVVKCLGAGSMGLVYACRHRELGGHLVAIKVLFPEVAQDNVAAQRFRIEIVASYQVSHPNVVRAYEYFRDGDLVAYTMEYVGGGDLADRLSRGEPLPIQEAIRLLAQIAAGVQAVHEAGIVHRDLKPENILLTPEGDVKITDFGIARAGGGQRLTEHGGVVGTIDYVSPEYLERGQVDARSDIYAVGVLAYEMITGESPFRGDSVIATMTMRLRSDPKPPSALRPDCPADLDTIILKAMERNPESRYQRALDICYDLQSCFPEAIPMTSGGFGMTSRSAAPVRKSPLLEEHNKPQSPTSQSPGVSPLVSSPGDRRSPPMGGRHHNPSSGFIEPALAKTQLLNQGLAHLAAHYEEDTIQEPLRMESVLSSSYQMPASNGVERPLGQISVSEGGLDRGRMRSLSQSVGEFQRTGWFLDALLVLVAILIALGVGLAVMNMVLPDLFQQKRSQDRPEDLIIYDNSYKTQDW